MSSSPIEHIADDVVNLIGDLIAASDQPGGHSGPRSTVVQAAIMAGPELTTKPSSKKRRASDTVPPHAKKPKLDAPATPTNNPDRKAATTLTDLPQELLGQIYHELWKSTPQIEFSCDIKGWPTKEPKFGACYDIPIYGPYGDYTNKHSKMPLWLLTCKKILEGGMIQLLSKSRSHTCLQFNAASEAESASVATSSSFGSVVAKETKQLLVNIETSFWAEESAVRKPTPVCHEQIVRLVPILSRDFVNLTALGFGFKVRATDYELKYWRRLDFSVLQGVNLSNLDTFGVNVFNQERDTSAEFASVRRICEQDTSMRGIKLIGKGKLLTQSVGSYRVPGTSRTLTCIWTSSKKLIASWEKGDVGLEEARRLEAGTGIRFV